MKIALLGYGKMGKTIENLAKQRGHDIVIKTNKETGYDISIADVAIDFSVPDAAFNNVVKCFKNRVPVVSGTTGWLDNYNKAVSICNEEQGAFIYASNFSLGVTIFFELNTQLAKMMANLKDYNVSIEEVHHTQKLDAPSGTAITLAQSIINEHPAYQKWNLNTETAHSIPITAKRIADVSGKHTISYSSPTDSISITHNANNRQGFAQGALVAAEWLYGKTGVFTMKDVLKIS
ncbi:4-hydroxy-tetrahydrodipicolinate reductase [Bizionia sediminis]|uniref:4-hydroxy-tetrahydrodipicolinate reductase n=1 Tax=Bizionia sediminis TaxID=1737064 RepID=A0ABW5KPC6_9FLAO